MIVVQGFCHRKKLRSSHLHWILYWLLAILTTNNLYWVNNLTKWYFSWLTWNRLDIDWDRGNYPYLKTLHKYCKPIAWRNWFQYSARREIKNSFVKVIPMFYFSPEFTWVSFDVCEQLYSRLSKLSSKWGKRVNTNIVEKKSVFYFFG